MHEYSIDARRNKILFYLSLLAIALASTISALLHNLPFVTITIPVTSFTFFLLFVRIFNTKLWRKPSYQRIGITKTPDLNGEWQCVRFNEVTGEQTTCTLHIKQTWTKIRFEFKQDGYICVSYATAIQTRYPLGTRVSVAIQIFRVVKQHLPEKINTAFIDFIILSDDELQGRYYTNPQAFSQYGLITCTKINNTTNVNEPSHS